MASLLNNAQNCVSSLFHERQNKKVGVLFTGIVENDGRVWVETGSGSQDRNSSRRLKLRVTHLHPNNPALSDAIAKYRQQNGLKEPSGVEDEILLGQEQDYWFNHWNGPSISDNKRVVTSQPIGSQRRTSMRKSTRRCSSCNKKVGMIETPEISSSQNGSVNAGSLDSPSTPESPVFAHLPSIRRSQGHKVPISQTATTSPSPSSNSFLENYIQDGSDLSAIKGSLGGSQEQLSRVKKVLSHEQRVDLCMFADDAIDGSLNDEVVHVSPPQTSSNVAKFLSAHINSHQNVPVQESISGSFRRSKSCPVTPKHARKKSRRRRHFGSPESPHNSPKSVSSGSKFSLSNSLMALHKQASNSLRAELLKHDHNNKVGGSTSGIKMRSIQDNVKMKMSHSSINEEDNNSEFSEDDENSRNRLSVPVNPALYAKKPIQESKSLPTLKSCKTGVYAQDEMITEEETDNYNDGFGDVTFVVSPGDNSNGVVNLGFDGHGESSDFSEEVEKHHFSENENIIQVPAMSLGHSNSFSSNTSGLDLAPHNISIEDSSEFEYPNSESNSEDRNFDLCTSFDSDNGSSMRTDFTINSSAPSTARCSESALRIRVMDDVLPGRHIPYDRRFSNHEAAVLALELEKRLYLQETVSSSGVVSGYLRPRRPIPPRIKTDFVDDNDENYQLEDDLINDSMMEARAMVYWWENNADLDGLDNAEFCLREGQCKQKPLMMFVHGMGGSSDDWFNQVWYFASQGYEVVAPDLLGHGFSAAPDSEECYEFHRLLEHLRLLYDLFVPPGRKCVLIGHGYGCSLVTALSRIQSHSVPLLVLAGGGGPCPLLPLSPEFSSFYHPYFGIKESLYASTKRSFMNCWCNWSNNDSSSPDYEEPEDKWERMKEVVSATCWFACCFPCVFCKCDEVYNPLGKQQCSGTLSTPGASATPTYVLRHVAKGMRWPEGDVSFHRRITIPVLLLYGLNDKVVPLVHMCDMEKTIPRAFLETIGSSGHYSMLDNPTYFNESLHAFVKRWKRLT